MIGPPASACGKYGIGSELSAMSNAWCLVSFIEALATTGIIAMLNSHHPFSGQFGIKIVN